jgi:hypothetical protein
MSRYSGGPSQAILPRHLDPYTAPISFIPVIQDQGSSIGEVSRRLGITDQTYYRYGKEYGGMRVDPDQGGRSLTSPRGRRYITDMATRGDSSPGAGIRHIAEKGKF